MPMSFELIPHRVTPLFTLFPLDKGIVINRENRYDRNIRS
jgi:hypothetical protein